MSKSPVGDDAEEIVLSFGLLAIRREVRRRRVAVRIGRGGPGLLGGVDRDLELVVRIGDQRRQVVAVVEVHVHLAEHPPLL